jgi:hypothetical protein
MLIDAVFYELKVIKFFQRINAIVLKSGLAVFLILYLISG